MRWLISAVLAPVLALPLTLALAVPGQAQHAQIDTVLDQHILPGFAALAQSGQALNTAANADCQAQSHALRSAYHAAFDDWIRVSHLRFGPTETDDRAFALAFWPDRRGKTQKALNALRAQQDPAVETPEGFAEVSIAARGFFALDYLLYDAAQVAQETDAYTCLLIRAIAQDIALSTAAIAADWQGAFGAGMRAPTPEGRYRSETEVLQEMFKALSTGLEFTAEARLGRPLGSFEKPFPKRAESWRSQRSLRNVILSLESLRGLSALLCDPAQVACDNLDAIYGRALSRAGALDDPGLQGVADPQSRFRIEALQQDVRDARAAVSASIGPSLGVRAGFNALDGD